MNSARSDASDAGSLADALGRGGPHGPAQAFVPIAARPAPVRQAGAVAWLRRNLFSNTINAVATLVIVALLVWLLPGLVRWAVLDAVTTPNADACRQVMGSGACWGVVVEKYRIILFGRYPYAEQWRPAIATVLMIAMVVASGRRALWNRWLALAWLVVLPVVFVLMRGGVAGLVGVETDRWGGLPLTVLLATLCIAAAFPLAIAVALGRRSVLPAISAVSTVYVELVRGVPLISVLFMASFMFPLFMPQGVTIDVLVRVFVGITLFAAAYLAEVIRGGLQSIPKGQVEAAQSIGLSYWQTQRKIVLPQALATVVPGIINSFISTFKDSSLVTIVSLYELTGALGLAVNGDADWRPFKLEGYLFIAAIYFAACYAMSRYSRSIESDLDRSRAR